MYTSFFGLQEKPFAITPDPRYLYLSERHAEALAHLLYGINEAGGFIQLTGEVGTGKTTVIRSLLEQLPGHAEVALILNPRITPPEFLLTICEELHLQVPAESRNSTKVWTVEVQYDNGQRGTFTYDADPGVQNGDRVQKAGQFIKRI